MGEPLILKNEKDTFTVADSTELVYWATSCSFVYGKIPSLAHSALNIIYRESLLFEEDCAPNMQRNSEFDTDAGIKDESYTLFPNPTSSQLFILSSNESIEHANCRIQSLDGRLIYNGTIDFKAGLSLNELFMATGVYLIELNISETNETFHKSFLYTKE